MEHFNRCSDVWCSRREVIQISCENSDLGDIERSHDVPHNKGASGAGKYTKELTNRTTESRLQSAASVTLKVQIDCMANRVVTYVKGLNCETFTCVYVVRKVSKDAEVNIVVRRRGKLASKVE